jgi:hypothetical protein
MRSSATQQSHPPARIVSAKVVEIGLCDGAVKDQAATLVIWSGAASIMGETRVAMLAGLEPLFAVRPVIGTAARRGIDACQAIRMTLQYQTVAGAG